MPRFDQWLHMSAGYLAELCVLALGHRLVGGFFGIFGAAKFGGVQGLKCGDSVMPHLIWVFAAHKVCFRKKGEKKGKRPQKKRSAPPMTGAAAPEAATGAPKTSSPAMPMMLLLWLLPLPKKSMASLPLDAAIPKSIIGCSGW